MPTYEYKCDECKKVFDVTGTYYTMLSYKPTCPDCGSEKVQKKIGSVVFLFKGTGFHHTDYPKEEKPLTKEE